MGKRVIIPKDKYLSGMESVVANIQGAIDCMDRTSVQGLADALLFTATESQQRAPVNTGDLRGSIQVTIDNFVIASGVKGGSINIDAGLPQTAVKGSVSFNTKYAAAQHEQINYSHPHGGQAKYLESVLVDNKDRLLKLIADKITLGGDE